MPTTILDGETYDEARYRRFSEEAKDIYKMNNPEFESWWEHEGSSLEPALGEDAKEHAKRVAAIAWINGDFCALAEQVDLTDEELDALWYGNTKCGWRGLFRAVIAAYKEKNK